MMTASSDSSPNDQNREPGPTPPGTMVQPDGINVNVWNHDDARALLQRFNDALIQCEDPVPETMGSAESHVQPTSLQALGDALQAVHERIESDEGRGGDAACIVAAVASVHATFHASTHEHHVQPMWPFLNAPLPLLRPNLDMGDASNQHATRLWHHPLMAVARWGSLSTLSWLIDAGHLRPLQPNVTHRHPIDNVARVVAARGLSGGLAVLQRYETDPTALSIQAMRWIGGAVGARQAAVIDEARPWFDPDQEARAPFTAPMDSLLVAGPMDHQDDRAVLRATLDAMLRLAPWTDWRHTDAHDNLRTMTIQDWLHQVIHEGATWAFGALFPTACPAMETFDVWRREWSDLEDVDVEDMEVIEARQTMIVQVEQWLLRETNGLEHHGRPLRHERPSPRSSRRRL